jgi:hypothetical protein
MTSKNVGREKRSTSCHEYSCEKLAAIIQKLKKSISQSYVYEKGAYFAAGRESVADYGSGAVVRKMISRLFHSYQ